MIETLEKCNTRLPLFIKPNFADNSNGIDKDSVCYSLSDAVKKISSLRKMFPGKPVLVQEFLSGDEFTVGLIGNGDHWEALPVLTVDYSALNPQLPCLLAFESKWDPSSDYWNQIEYKKVKDYTPQIYKIIEYSKQLANRLGLKDYARFDWRTGVDGIIRLLETNPNPGWCWDGKLNKMAGLAGLAYSDLLAKIIYAGETRYITH